MNQANIDFPSALETVALLNWKRGSVSGCLEAPFPNGAGFWRIEGNKLVSYEFAGDFEVVESDSETLVPTVEADRFEYEHG